MAWDHSTQWFGHGVRRWEVSNYVGWLEESGGPSGRRLAREGKGEWRGHRGTQKGCLEGRVVMASWTGDKVRFSERWDKMRWTRVYHEAACL